jgi:serine protease AprX
MGRTHTTAWSGRSRARGRVAWLVTALALVLPAAAASALPVPAAHAPIERGIVTYPDRPALLSGLDTLSDLGLTVQGLQRLPMALVEGTPAQLARVDATGRGARYWPDEPLEYLSVDSNKAIGVDKLHAQGLTGEGVTVAVIDTGVDATVPALKDQVTHNVVMLGAQRAQEVAWFVDPGPLLVTPVDLGPGTDTDTDSHGTMVAGIVAGNGAGSDDNGPLGTSYPAATAIGVAPDAEVIGYSVGSKLGTTMPVAAMDDILAHPEWGVDVVNNSYGNAKFSVFDPASPLSVATKALHDKGITVVFGAGNEGAGGEMNVSAWSVAPWQISVGATDMAGTRADFSAVGLPLDNSVAAPLVGGHVSATGDRLGIYHPSVMAPGANIATVCPTVHTERIGCLPGYATGPTGDGTSFASPNVAGVVALLRQARPDLSPDQVRQTLEVTAVPTSGEDPAWRAGFGVVDAQAAADLVRLPKGLEELPELHADAEAALVAARPWRVERSDLWTTTTPAVTVGGVTALPVHTLQVAPSIDALKVSIASYDSAETAKFTVVVRDAAGRELGRTQRVGATSGGPVATVLLDLPDLSPAYGDWTLSVEGVAGYNDEQARRGEVDIVVHAAQLKAKP